MTIIKSASAFIASFIVISCIGNSLPLAEEPFRPPVEAYHSRVYLSHSGNGTVICYSSKYHVRFFFDSVQQVSIESWTNGDIEVMRDHNGKNVVISKLLNDRSFRCDGNNLDDEYSVVK